VEQVKRKPRSAVFESNAEQAKRNPRSPLRRTKKCGNVKHHLLPTRARTIKVKFAALSSTKPGKSFCH
jgi:hypothetical protein